MANSVDPDQLASSEANWSGSTLFARLGISGFNRTRVNTFRNESYICFLLELILSFKSSYPREKDGKYFWIRYSGLRCIQSLKAERNYPDETADLYML